MQISRRIHILIVETLIKSQNVESLVDCSCCDTGEQAVCECILVIHQIICIKFDTPDCRLSCSEGCIWIGCSGHPIA